MLRYDEFTDVIATDEGVRRYSTLYYPMVEPKNTDVWIITKKMDRLDLMAHQYYGDVRYWPIIAKANRLHQATIRPPIGIRLRIPNPLNPDDIGNIFREYQF